MSGRDPRDLHTAAWPDMFENLHTAYAELTRAQFELERRTSEIDEARGLFQRVIRSMSEALFLLDTSGRIIQTNQAAATMLRTTEEAMLAQPLDEVWGSPDIPATPWRLLERAPDGAINDLDLELRRAGGQTVPVTVSCSIVRDQRGKIGGVLAVARDITERKRAEDALRFMANASSILARSLDLKTILNDLAHTIVPALADWCSIDVVGADGGLEHFAAAHIDHAREPLIAELRRRYPLPADSPMGYACVLRSANSVLVSDVRGEHVDRISRDPGYRSLVATLGVSSHLCVPMLSRGRPTGAITLNYMGADRRYTPADVKVAEDLARRAAVAVENARLYQAAQDANRMKDEFLATLSHELRTPLNAILGWVRLLRRTQETAGRGQIARALEVIERNAAAQRQLIEALLDLSGIVAGKLRFEPQAVDLGRIVESAADALRLAADAKGIRVVTDIAPAIPAVPGDPDRLQQVVLNLLSNAIKFTPASGDVTLSVRAAGDDVEVAVADTGKGIRPEFLPHVFDPFRQEDASTTRAYGGLGLGLSIVKNLVELHGGTVFAESAGEGRGSRFVVRLPALGGGSAARRTASPVADRGTLPPDLRGIRVLVVEDEPDARTMLRLMLEDWGVMVAEAASARDAMEQLADSPPDLLVCDIGLPHEDGYALIRRVRGLAPEQGGRIPAVALTAYARDEDRRRAEAAGFQRHLAKPFDPVDLATAIAALARPDPAPP